jgi:hemolysin D
MKSFRSDPTPRSNAEPDKVVRLFQSETGEIVEAPEPAGVRITFHVLAFFLVSLLVLSLVTRLDRVVTSTSGAIVTTRPTAVLQALDASIIKSINVRDGERVKAGDELATLDPTFAAADVESLKLQIGSLDAVVARCEAELANRPYEPKPSANPDETRYAELQKALYQQRKAQFEGQVRAYNEQIAQYTAAVTKFQNSEGRYNDRVKLAREVEQMRATLAAAQVGSRLALLVASDQKTEILRNLEYDHDSLLEARHQVEATTATRNAFAQQWLAQTSQELVTARNQRDTALQQLEKASKHKDLVRLAATEDAVVLQMAKLSVGSVLKEGEPLIYLAPLSSPVEADVRISPQDVGFIRAGDPVKVKLDAFNFIEHGMVSGTVRWISEGAFTIDDTNNTPVPTPYYKVRVTLTDTELKKVPPGFRLIPGMTLTADVHIGTRSILMYLVSGALRGTSEAMREP